MRKILKFILIACLPVVLLVAAILIPFASSTNDEVIVPTKENKLETALQALEDQNYTIKSSNIANVTVSYGDEEESYSTSASTIYEINPTESYIVNSENGNVLTQYMKQENDFVHQYIKIDGGWSYLGSVSIDEQQVSDLDIIDIETKDAFEEIDGVYYGNLELINEYLEEFFDKYSEQLTVAGQLALKMECTKYNITLKDGQVDKIDFAFVIKTRDSFTSMTIEMDMVMRFSKIGETKVTVPYRLPEIGE